jgi:hypothetical protein
MTTWISFLGSLVFETGSLIGLECTKKARLASQQTIGILLSPPSQCWSNSCMPSFPIVFTQVLGLKLRASYFHSKHFTYRCLHNFYFGFDLTPNGTEFFLNYPSKRPLSSCLLPTVHSLHSFSLLF